MILTTKKTLNQIGIDRRYVEKLGATVHFIMFNPKLARVMKLMEDRRMSGETTETNQVILFTEVNKVTAMHYELAVAHKTLAEINWDHLNSTKLVRDEMLQKGCLLHLDKAKENFNEVLGRIDEKTPLASQIRLELQRIAELRSRASKGKANA